MDEDKLPFNWTAGRYISKKETKQQQQLELKIKSLTDSTTINLNIDSNNPDVQSAIEDAKIELENAKEEFGDVLMWMLTLANLMNVDMEEVVANYLDNPRKKLPGK